jgi:uncharacterized protein (TIGR02996 family)
MSIEKILARAAKKAGDPAAALGLLLEAWQEGRAPEVAELVKRMSALAGQKRAPITGEKREELQKAWMTAEKPRDPADLDRLIVAIAKGQCLDSGDRLAKLAKWPDDPRLRDALVDGICAPLAKNGVVPLNVQPTLSEAIPFTSKPNRGFWIRKYLPLLERLGDASVVPRIRVAQAARPQYSEFLRWIHDRVEKLLPIFEARPVAKLDDKERAAAAEIAKALDRTDAAAAGTGRTLDALLAAVWERPEEDEPRQVLADFLADQGDPRGEFINLQMARHRKEITAEGKKREKELLKRHKKAWLGPIEKFIQMYALRFERGFLVTCQIEHGVDKLDVAIVRHPAWSTIREYRIHHRTAASKPLCDMLDGYGAKPITGLFTRGVE